MVQTGRPHASAPAVTSHFADGVNKTTGFLHTWIWSYRLSWKEVRWEFWHRGLEPAVGFWASHLQHSSKIKTDLKPKYIFVQVFLLDVYSIRPSTAAPGSSVRKYRFKVNSNAHTLVKCSRCGRFRLIVRQASLCSVSWMETKSLSLRLWEKSDLRLSLTMIPWEAAAVGSNRRVRLEPKHSSWCCQGCISLLTPNPCLLSHTLVESSPRDP